jgi:transcriptional regulator with XRE-family HTH domain
MNLVRRKVDLREFDPKSCGRRLSILRRKLKLKQKDIAELTGRTTSAVGYWETGKSIIPTEVVAKLVEVYGVSPLWLLFGEGPMFLGDILSATEKKEELTDQEVLKVIKKLDLESVIDDLIKGSEYYARVGIRLREILEKIKAEED